MSVTPRSAERWHQQLGNDLRVFPTFSLHLLGLSHLHVFIREPREHWWSFPYAVEGWWLSSNFRDRVLYLHCVVPLVHHQEIEALIREVVGERACVLWSSHGWQSIALTHNDLTEPIPLDREGDLTGVVPHELAFAIPTIFEGWNEQVSLSSWWERIYGRVGDGVRWYLRGRIHPTNGKRHIKTILHALNEKQLFRQQVIRYAPVHHDTVGLVIIAPTHCKNIREQLQGMIMTETYASTDGRTLLRAYGKSKGIYELQRLARQHPDTEIFFLADEPNTPVRFQYELLFNPSTNEWVFPREQILADLEGAA